MYFRMKTQNFLVGLLTVGISLSAGSAIAVPLSTNNHAYALESSFSNVMDITGSQVTYSKGTEALSYNGTQGFINKEIWAVFAAGPTCWLETGATKGGISSTFATNSPRVFQNGHFIGYQSVNQSNALVEYHEAPYGVNTGVTGAQTYSLEKAAGGGNWLVKVNGTVALTLNSIVCPASTNYLANGADHIDVGIESADSAAVFTNPTAASSWTIRKGSGAYQSVSSATNRDKNTSNWTSKFVPASGSSPNGIVFAR
jgi:hypothetical protein